MQTLHMECWNHGLQKNEIIRFLFFSSPAYSIPDGKDKTYPVFSSGRKASEILVTSPVPESNSYKNMK